MEEKKEVLFDAFPKQIEFLEAVVSGKYRLIVYGGAIRGGKTFAGLGALIILCKMYPKSRWAVVRTDLMTLKRNTIQSWNKIKPVNFIKHYNQDTQTITFQNGAQILFFAENYNEDKELERWKGLEVNGFLLEEMPELQLKSFYKAFERSGSHVIPNKPPPLIIGTCNPSNNWVKEQIYDKWKTGKMPDTWLYIPSKLFDNPFVAQDKEYLDSLRFMPRYEYEVFVDGNWDIQKKSGAEFYKEYDMDVHIKKCDPDPEYPIWVFMDENVNPYFPATLWQFKGQDAYCIKEFALKNPNNTTDKFAAELDRYLTSIQHEGGLYLSGDATSKKDDVKIEKGMNLFTLVQAALTRLGRASSVRNPKSNPNVSARQNFINTVMYNQKRGEPFKGIQIFIDEDCKLTNADLQNVKESPKDKGGKHKEEETDPESGIKSQKWGHFSDTLDYALCQTYPTEYALFQKGKPGFSNIQSGKRQIRNNW